MKTLYVGVPVEGRKYSEVMADIRVLHKVAENIFGEELEVVDCYRVGELREQWVDDRLRHNVAKNAADRYICVGCNRE